MSAENNSASDSVANSDIDDEDKLLQNLAKRRTFRKNKNLSKDSTSESEQDATPTQFKRTTKRRATKKKLDHDETTLEKNASQDEQDADNDTVVQVTDSPARRRSVRARKPKKTPDDTVQIPKTTTATVKKTSKRKKKNNSSASSSSESEDYSDSTDPDESEDETLQDKITNSKIIAYKDFEEPADAGKVTKFCMLHKDRSHLHVFWVTEQDLNKNSRMKSQLTQFLKRFPVKWEEDEPLFNPNFTRIERILNVKLRKRKQLYLVKWKDMGYEESTWEYYDQIKGLKNADKHIKRYELRNIVDETKRAEPNVKRNISNYKPMDTDSYKYSKDLRPYQIEGVNWLMFSWFSKRNSILADEMGLGKTIQSISFLEYMRSNFSVSGPFLVVAPLATLKNWYREVNQWSRMNPIVYNGSVAAREVIKRYEFRYRDAKNKPVKDLYKFDVLICNYETILADTKLVKIPWKCMIVDEAQRLKNQNSKIHNTLRQVNTEHTVLLTGTPLQNDLQELWSLLNFIDREKFPNAEEFLSKYGELKEKQHVESLQTELKPYLLRRIKEDVEKDLPRKEETIIEVELTSTQKQYYRAIIEKNRDFLARGNKRRQNNNINLLNTFMEIRKVCNHPYLIKGAEDSLMQEAGLQKASTEATEYMIKCSAKLILVDKLLQKLRKDKKNKVLIFSQMLGVLDILEDYLEYRNWDFERLDGRISGDQKQQAIDRFNTNENSFVFLLSTRAGGVGINLTAANTVVIFDSDFNPQNDLQAQSRCHRIGQTQDVKVFRLITRNTYEKYMLEVASKKLGLEKAILNQLNDADGATTDSSKKTDLSATKTGFNDEEIEALLKYGAYHMFSESDVEAKKQETMLLESDIDQILEKTAHVVTYETNQSFLNTFAKASFCPDDKALNIDLYDQDFWEKILPEFVKPETLLTKINNGEATVNTESRSKFMGIVQKLIDTTENPSSLTKLVHTISINANFSDEERKQAQEWGLQLEQPRLRKRKHKVVANKNSDSDDDAENQRKKRRIEATGEHEEDEEFELRESSDDSEDIHDEYEDNEPATLVDEQKTSEQLLKHKQQAGATPNASFNVISPKKVKKIIPKKKPEEELATTINFIKNVNIINPHLPTKPKIVKKPKLPQQQHSSQRHYYPSQHPVHHQTKYADYEPAPPVRHQSIKPQQHYALPPATVKQDEPSSLLSYLRETAPETYDQHTTSVVIDDDEPQVKQEAPFKLPSLQSFAPYETPKDDYYSRPPSSHHTKEARYQSPPSHHHKHEAPNYYPPAPPSHHRQQHHHHSSSYDQQYPPPSNNHPSHHHSSGLIHSYYSDNNDYYDKHQYSSYPHDNHDNGYPPPPSYHPPSHHNVPNHHSSYHHYEKPQHNYPPAPPAPQHHQYDHHHNHYREENQLPPPPLYPSPYANHHEGHAFHPPDIKPVRPAPWNSRK